MRLNFPPFLQFFFCDLDLFRAEAAIALNFLDNFFRAMEVAGMKTVRLGKFQPGIEIVRQLRYFPFQNLNSRSQITTREQFVN